MGQVLGAIDWGLARSRSWGKEYKIAWKVRVDSTADGPNAALRVPGLPQPGDTWAVKDDADADAYCLPDATVKPFAYSDEPNLFYVVEQTFSTDQTQVGNCLNAEQSNPLLQPHKVSGTFNRYTEEATVDRFGRQLLNSAFEQIRGPQVEFDRNRPAVRIEQNVALLELPLLAQMVDSVNAYPLWGLAPRMVKLSNAPWEAKFYGQCLRYYTRTLEFDINYDTWDRLVLDEGTKCLNGRWGLPSDDTNAWILTPLPSGEMPSASNPSHFMRAPDRQGNPMHVILDGAGKPWDGGRQDEAKWWCVVGLSTNPGDVGLNGPFADGPPQAVTATCLNATCADAFQHVEDLNDDPDAEFFYTLAGPFGDQDECHAGCDPDVAETAPLAQDCSRPGRTLIQRYREADFALLGIPLDF